MPQPVQYNASAFTGFLHMGHSMGLTNLVPQVGQNTTRINGESLPQMSMSHSGQWEFKPLRNLFSLFLPFIAFKMAHCMGFEPMISCVTSKRVIQAALTVQILVAGTGIEPV